MSSILLVEDDEIIAKMYCTLFQKENFDIASVLSGIDSHQKAIEISPDLILMDIMMPRMNGFEALDVIRADSRTTRIPVIILTNLADEYSKDEALRRGVVNYLIKSDVENSQLVSLVRETIDTYSSIVSFS